MIIAGVSLLILNIWPKIKKVASVPAPLIVVVVGSILAAVFAGSGVALNKEQYVLIPIVNSTTEFYNLFTTPDFSSIFSRGDVWITAVTIALVASLESLLSLEAVDKIDPIKRISPTNRELIAQGTGNILSGLLGGLPLTAVIVRSSANVNAGARTKVSAISHGFLLLISLLAIPVLINMIPLSCLAAILLMTGYKLTRISLFKHMWQKGIPQFVPFVVTVLAVVLIDLLKGVGIGIFVAGFFILYTNLRNPYFYKITHDGEGKKVIHINLAEEVSFLNKAAIQVTLTSLPKSSDVVIDGTNSRYIDPDVLEIIHNFKHNAFTKGIVVQLKGIKDRYDVPKLKELNYKP